MSIFVWCLQWTTFRWSLYCQKLPNLTLYTLWHPRFVYPHKLSYFDHGKMINRNNFIATWQNPMAVVRFFPAHSQLTQLPGRAGWSPSHFGPPGVVEPSLVDGPWMAIIIVSGYSMGQPWVPKKARNPRMFQLTKWTAAQISPNHDIMSYRQIGLSKSRMPENPMVSNLIFTMIHDWYPRTCHGSATGSTKGLPKESWFSSGSTAFIFEPIWYLLGKDLGPLGMLKLAW